MFKVGDKVKVSHRDGAIGIVVDVEKGAGSALLFGQCNDSVTVEIKGYGPMIDGFTWADAWQLEKVEG